MIRKMTRLWRERATAIAERDEMADRLHEFQVQVEVATEALAKKDISLLKFIDRLHDTMGGLTKPTCEGDTMARLRVIRAQADKYKTIRDGLAGNINPDSVLIRNLACAMGTSSLSVDAIVKRADVLMRSHVANSQLNKRVASLQQQLDDETYDPDEGCMGG